MRNPFRPLFPVFAVLLLVSAVRAAEDKVFKATVDSSGVQKVEVSGGSYFFKPDYIVVKVNVPVELIVKKEPGATPHDITIKAPEAGIDFKESLGTDPEVVKFTPTKTGKYSFYCDKRFLFFKSHRGKGMEGTLEVTD